jgi:hypothetical protein
MDKDLREKIDKFLAQISPKYLCKSTIKRIEGWTDKTISMFLGGPDKRGINPHYKSGPKTSLYLESRVTEIEKSSKFRAFVYRNETSRAASKKAIQTKTKKLLEYVEKVPIVLERKNLQYIQQMAIKAFNDRSDEIRADIRVDQ